MENNILEILLKMISGANNQQQYNQSYATSYPKDSYQGQGQFDFGQNNMLPLILSLLKKPSQTNILSNNKSDENKKAEVSSALNDEILL